MSSKQSTCKILPGIYFEDVQQTNFVVKTIFDMKSNVDEFLGKMKTEKYGKYNQSFPLKGDISDLTAWLVCNKQVLCFDGYYQISSTDKKHANQIRKCKITYYLEDGTMKIVEPKQDDKGMIISSIVMPRHRVQVPDMEDDLYYDIGDLNIGNEIEAYGKCFKLTNCDTFTRTFLNGLGVYVPKAIPIPENEEHSVTKGNFAKLYTLGKFLKNGRCVLRYFGFWDDRNARGGTVHNLTIYYFLNDDSIEITEITKDKNGTINTSIFAKRAKLPKIYTHLPNIEGRDKISVVHAPKNITNNVKKMEYYTCLDLTIGSTINVYGKKVVLIEWDQFTRDFYKKEFGIDGFLHIPKPEVRKQFIQKQDKLPPVYGCNSTDGSSKNNVKFTSNQNKKKK